MRLILLLTLISALTVGCASVNSYKEPRTGSQPLATVSGSATQDGLFEYSNNTLTQIDNKPVGLHWSVNSKINVVPGYHSFTIHSMFNRGFGIGPYTSLTEVKLLVKPGVDYQLVGRPDGVTYIAWAEANKKRVSEIGRSNYQYTPQPTTIILPIIR